MNLSKACKLALLASFSCLLLMVFSGAIYGADTIRWTVTGNPTEVINTGRSEVSGSITLMVDSPGLIGSTAGVKTGNPAGGDDQLNITYGPNPNGPAVQIDNDINTGIRVYGAAFASQGKPLSLQVMNSTVFGPCAGQITVLVPAGVTLFNGDVIKIEGVRLRVDLTATPVNTDFWVQIQSVNDPAGNGFFPDAVRVAKSFPGMVVGTTSDVATLCFTNYGKSGPIPNDLFLTQGITITEGFFRAFVAKDSKDDGIPGPDDRVDTGGPLSTIGNPTPSWLGGGPPAGGVNVNGTMVKIYLSGIANSVVSVSWPAQVFSNIPGNVSWFQLVPTPTFTAGTVGKPGDGNASAVYEYHTINQTGGSDITLENFAFNPALRLSAINQQDTGIVLAGATLWPAVDTPLTNCDQPHPPSFYSTNGKPRFVTLYQSSGGSSGLPDATTKQLPSQFGVYEQFAGCRCFLLFPYVVASQFYDTGVSVANTSLDSQVFGALGAPTQGGTVTWWLYDAVAKSLNSTGINLPTALQQPGYGNDSTGTTVYQAGQTMVGLVSQLVAQLSKPPASFTGYMIARANFQYCHGFAFVADKGFATISQGYLAPIIPDPAVKGPYRTASAAADVITKLLAGESLNN